MGRVAEEIIDDTPPIGPRCGESAVVADDREPGRIDPAPRIFAAQGSDFFKKARFPLIVGVEQGDQVAPRLGNSPVAGGTLSGIGLADKTNQSAALFGSYDFDDRGAAIRRPVVDHDDFLRPKRLRQHGAERTGNLPFLVVERDNDRNEGIVHNLSFSCEDTHLLLLLQIKPLLMTLFENSTAFCAISTKPDSTFWRWL